MRRYPLNTHNTALDRRSSGQLSEKLNCLQRRRSSYLIGAGKLSRLQKRRAAVCFSSFVVCYLSGLGTWNHPSCDCGRLTHQTLRTHSELERKNHKLSVTVGAPSGNVRFLTFQFIFSASVFPCSFSRAHHRACPTRPQALGAPGTGRFLCLRRHCGAAKRSLVVEILGWAQMRSNGGEFPRFFII